MVFWNCDYIGAYNYSTKLYYKLKGFRNNDFAEFISHLQMHPSTPIPEYIIADKDAFLTFYNIEDTDLECLWVYYYGKRKKNKIFPCINSCVERDLLIEDPY